MDPYLLGYIVLVLIYRLSETVVMARTGTLTRRPSRDWTVWLVIAGTALEYVWQRSAPPRPVALLCGPILFLAATVVRGRSHLDLGAQFSMFLERGRERGLVTTGLYAFIRHPLYLANILLFLACLVFLAVAVSWVATAIGIVGVMVRIEMEERFLRQPFEGCGAYARTASKLLPRIY